MTRLSISFALAACLLVSCGPKPSGDVLAPKVDKTVARITQCTTPNSDGVSCDRKTCTKDEISDCTIFRDRCKASDHEYDGDDNSGTCTRKEPIG